jgi:hypothetical protein
VRRSCAQWRARAVGATISGARGAGRGGLEEDARGAEILRVLGRLGDRDHARVVEREVDHPDHACGCG